MGELAYAIDPAEHGWRWRVFDIEGELVAGGVAPSQAEAEARAFRSSGAEPPASLEI
ncbi:hypothetical protein [Phenylobacterium sp.]|uniref:hypothetical protein n=1 Tax=Phenylobacterium sp. TaxID=1871053 RepID=UPI0035B0A73F